MKRLIVLLSLMACTAGAALADEGKPVMQQGTLGWLFGFKGLSTFGIGGLFDVGWHGYTPAGANDAPSGTPASVQALHSTDFVPAVGIRYFLSNAMALRAGLGLGITSQTNVGGTKDHTASETLLGLQALLEWHMTGIGSVTPYFGAGLGFQTASSSDKANASASESKASASLFQVLGAIGFQWFVVNRISLGAEYELGLGLESGSTTAPGGSAVDAPSSTTVATSAFSVMLSLYP